MAEKKEKKVNYGVAGLEDLVGEINGNSKQGGAVAWISFSFPFGNIIYLRIGADTRSLLLRNHNGPTSRGNSLIQACFHKHVLLKVHNRIKTLQMT